MTTTVGALMVRARAHHPSFGEEVVPAWSLLSKLSLEHRQLIRDMAEHLKSRLGEGRQIAAVIANSLVGIDSGGAPYATSTSDDGYDVIEDVAGFAYTGPNLLATDPFQDGFPMPDDSMKVLAIYATLQSQGELHPIHVFNLDDTAYLSGVAQLHAIMSGWRLKPVTNPPLNQSGTLWNAVTAVTVLYIPEPPRFQDLGVWETQPLLLPDLYCDALEMGLVAFCARVAATTEGHERVAPLIQVFEQEAQVARQRAIQQARFDEKPVRVHQARRNR